MRVIDSIITYSLFNLVGIFGNLFFRLANRTQFIGKKNIPLRSKILLVSNHQTMLDSFLISLPYFPTNLLHPHFVPWNVAAQENFFAHPLTKFIFNHLRCVPVERGKNGNYSPKQFVRLLNRLVQLLKEGNNILYFPEGGRERNPGTLREVKPGIGILIYKAQPKAIVPIWIDSHRIQPVEDEKGAWTWPRIGQRATVIYGRPLDVSHFYKLPPTKETYQAIADFVIQKIGELKPK
jgi:1-acyl-sn-glycerol-3-phosphate acyltransferase